MISLQQTKEVLSNQFIKFFLVYNQKMPILVSMCWGTWWPQSLSIEQEHKWHRVSLEDSQSVLTAHKAKTPPAKSHAQFIFISPTQTNKKLGKADEHRRRRRRRRRRKKDSICGIYVQVMSDSPTHRQETCKRRWTQKKKKRLHLWNPCTIHVCSPKKSRKLQKKKDDRRRSFASYTKA